ncbi:MAG: sigma-70 family RNA polymerase sigma factor [Sedimentisphaerales bacterium]
MKEIFTNEFQEFWSRSAPKVRAYMFCACENSTEADDMAQDCCLRAFRAWNQFNGRASRQAWLFGIARRTRIDWLRKRKRENATIESKKVGQQSEAVSEEPNKDSIEKVWDAVKNLNDEYSEVIHLRFAVGLSYEQIAHTLEIPVGTVRSRLHRGLKAIREHWRTGKWIVKE